jgi:hypothetical protein
MPAVKEAQEEREALMRQYYAAVDARDMGRMVSYLDPDIELIVGNGAPVHGVGPVLKLAADSAERLGGTSHKVRAFYHDVASNCMIIEVETVFRRLDDRLVAVPALGIAHFNSNKLIDKYRIYADLAPVWA